MIDTVVFRIKDIIHEPVCKLFSKRLMLMTSRDTAKQNCTRQALKTSVRQVKPAEYIKARNSRFGDKLYQSVSGYINVPSHTYDCLWTYPEQKDYIEFNFSLPKANYGTNILMFVGHDPFYNPFMKAVDRNEQGLRAYDNLVSFLVKFLVYVSGFTKDELYILFEHLVICRFDMCVNQVFNSVLDARRYVECLKRTRKKKSRDISKDKVYDTTGVYYASDNYTVKIYWKGAEFEKHDMKEIQKRGVFDELHIQALQDLANRMVRYEMEIRNRYMSGVYIASLFRLNDSMFSEMKFCSMLYRRRFFKIGIDQQVKFIRDHIVPFINFDLRKSYTGKYRHMWSDMKEKVLRKGNIRSDLKFFVDMVRRNAKNYELYVSKTLDFVLSLNQDEKLFSERTTQIDVDGFIYRAKFSKSLFMKFYEKFWQFVDDYDIKESLLEVENSDTSEILKRKFKAAGMENRRIAPYIALYNLLQQGETFKEIRLKKVFAKATLDRYISIFKKININDKCVDIYNINRQEPLKSYFNFVYFRKKAEIRHVINCSFYKLK